MKVVKRIIVGVLIAALASAGIYTGLMHVKESKVTEVPVTSVSNLMTDWYSETTLDGTITTNVAQNVNMDKDMIIEKIYVSQGDDVKKGDNLISFDMTLVEMELNIAKLKLQKQEQDLTKAQNRLTSLQNGGPIEDSTDSTDDTELNSTDGNTGDSNMTSTDIPSDGSGDDEMQSTTGSLGTAVDGILRRHLSRCFSVRLQIQLPHQKSLRKQMSLMGKRQQQGKLQTVSNWMKMRILLMMVLSWIRLIRILR